MSSFNTAANVSLLNRLLDAFCALNPRSVISIVRSIVSCVIVIALLRVFWAGVDSSYDTIRYTDSQTNSTFTKIRYTQPISRVLQRRN